MPTKPLSDEVLQEAVDAFKTHGRKYLAAKALGIPDNTLDSRLKVASERGLMLDHPPAMPGFRISQVSTDPDGGKHIQQKREHGDVFELPEGHIIKGVSALVDEDGREVVKWIKTQVGPSTEDAIGAIKEAFKDFEGTSKPIERPVAVNEDLLTFTPVNDLHMGLHAWGKDTGVDWDLKISERVIGQAVDNLVAAQKSSGTAIVLGGGDLFHADNKENKTARSGNVLDVDGRYEKVMQVSTRLMVRIVDRHLERHGKVIVRILPGNHDEHSAVAVAYFLLAWYRNEPRVVVDVDPSLFFWYRFGSVLLGATHGHTVKLEKMAGIMAHRRAVDWGQTKHRYIHGFHIHHSSKYVTEGEGVISESHQAPIPPDAWHFGAGYLSGRSMQSITYNRFVGDAGRVREPIMDGVAANDNNPRAALAA